MLYGVSHNGKKASEPISSVPARFLHTAGEVIEKSYLKFFSCFSLFDSRMFGIVATAGYGSLCKAGCLASFGKHVP